MTPKTSPEELNNQLKVVSADALPDNIIKNGQITSGQEEVDDYDWELNPEILKEWNENPDKGCDHPLFMKEIPRNIDDNPDLVALQQLVFGEKTPEQIALQFKNVGNDFLADGKKRYKEAIQAYTKGLEEEAKDDKLNSIIYGNRAQAYLNLNQFVEAVDDARKSVGLDATNVKAFFRGAKASFNLKLYRQCIKFCEGGLEHDKDNKAIGTLKQQCEEKILEAEVRKMKLEEQQKKKTETNSANESEFSKKMKSAGINIGGMLYDMGAVYKSKGKLTAEGKLATPIALLYDEYCTSDFIENVLIEEESLNDHLEVLFPSDRHADWDVEGKYTKNNLRAFIELPPSQTNDVHLTPVVVEMNTSKLIIEEFKRAGIVSAIPVIHLGIRNSPAESAFLQTVHIRR